MLKLQSDSVDFIYSGFCYIDSINNFRFSGAAVTKVYFRKFSEEEINNCIENMPVLTWSGAFYPGIPYGASLIKKVEGSLSSFLYGLPTELLIPQLEKSGIKFSPKQGF
jgi:predicted house-cleaning NTP pyrophosphatase (Maf/HAM1 superfamily)